MVLWRLAGVSLSPDTTLLYTQDKVGKLGEFYGNIEGNAISSYWISSVNINKCRFLFDNLNYKMLKIIRNSGIIKFSPLIKGVDLYLNLDIF